MLEKFAENTELTAEQQTALNEVGIVLGRQYLNLEREEQYRKGPDNGAYPKPEEAIETFKVAMELAQKAVDGKDITSEDFSPKTDLKQFQEAVIAAAKKLYAERGISNISVLKENVSDWATSYAETTPSY